MGLTELFEGNVERAFSYTGPFFNREFYKMERAFGTRIDQHTIYIPGIL